MASQPSSPEASRSALWRLNSELRSANEALEREVAALRREVAARRLTRSGAGSSLRASISGASSPTTQASLGPAGTAATERLAELEAQLVQAARAAADKQAALEAAMVELQAAQAATAVADAGIAALTAQLREREVGVAELGSQLAAAQERAAAADAERAAVEDMAARTAERVLALEAQIAELLRQADAEAGQQASGSSPAPAVALRPSSRAEYAAPTADGPAAGALPPLAEGGSQPFTRVYSALLPPPSDVEAAQERQALQQDVARLASRLAAAEAELAEQLQQKQEALGRLAAAQGEAASLRRCVGGWEQNNGACSYVALPLHARHTSDAGSAVLVWLQPAADTFCPTPHHAHPQRARAAPRAGREPAAGGVSVAAGQHAAWRGQRR